MAVIAVLIGLLMPSLASIRETARRVVCASNVRQHGLGIAMYADDSNGFLIPSKYGNAARNGEYSPQMMTVLRTSDTPAAWDGLGHLFKLEYLEAPGVFYCPSHRGEKRLNAYNPVWNASWGEIQGNYQFRGTIGERLDLISDGRAIVTDGLRTQLDYSHGVGSNVLKADFGVGWFKDDAGRVAATLPTVEERDGAVAASRVDQAWHLIDLGVRAR